MTSPTHIEPVEQVHIDRARLACLGRSMGRDAATRVVEHALEDVAERICAVRLAWRSGEFARMVKAARTLIAVAEQIGMASVAEVSRDVISAFDARDEAALAAIVARLVRVGDASLDHAARAEILSI